LHHLQNFLSLCQATCLQLFSCGTAGAIVSTSNDTAFCLSFLWDIFTTRLFHDKVQENAHVDILFLGLVLRTFRTRQQKRPLFAVVVVQARLRSHLSCDALHPRRACFLSVCLAGYHNMIAQMQNSTGGANCKWTRKRYLHFPLKSNSAPSNAYIFCIIHCNS